VRVFRGSPRGRQASWRPRRQPRHGCRFPREIGRVSSRIDSDERDRGGICRESADGPQTGTGACPHGSRQPDGIQGGSRTDRWRFLAHGAHASGRGRRPPAHRHANCSEAFFVLEGTITVELEGAAVAAGPGDFVRVSRGQAHTFGSAGDTLARLLVLHAPARDAYFKKLHELWSAEEPPSPEQERDLMVRYGMKPA
jgi:quercetin dioxygenase-like cupin family protein